MAGKGVHKMPDGSMMRNSAMKGSKTAPKGAPVIIIAIGKPKKGSKT